MTGDDSEIERRTRQYILPLKRSESGETGYDIYPTHILPDGVIHFGYDSLAERLSGETRIIIDGYEGVFYEGVRAALHEAFVARGLKSRWVYSGDFLKPEVEIELLTEPSMGGGDPLFGRRTDLELDDFFDLEKIKGIQPELDCDLNIIYGPGAALAGWNGHLVYVDLPKNELQYRARAGTAGNLGVNASDDFRQVYKRFYFVDWVALNRHKKVLQSRIDIYVDGQRSGLPVWAERETIRRGLEEMGRGCFRCRPWFEPGAWGGEWIQKNIPGLSPDVPNYAWSFELITPENGLIFESGGVLLELSFDTLMFQQGADVMGRHHSICGDEFPIRFDFLDTVAGGNLSVQCHPQPEYIRREFGETIAQEECYYILDAEAGAFCHLGFREGIHPLEFERDVSGSFRDNRLLDIARYVQRLPSKRHDFFLIPPGTIHGSGPGNLVLEISTTPYIFTFKMYDWLRPDLDGRPRPLNISRGMENLRFERCGQRVSRELISKPRMLEKGPGWECEELPTHPEHSYAVKRYRIDSQVDISTEGRCLVCNLVEGRAVRIEIAGGMKKTFHCAETFVVSAAAGSCRIVNESNGSVKLVTAFMK